MVIIYERWSYLRISGTLWDPSGSSLEGLWCRDVPRSRMMGFFRMIILLAVPIIPRLRMMARDDKNKKKRVFPPLLGGQFRHPRIILIPGLGFGLISVTMTEIVILQSSYRLWGDLFA